MDTFVVISGCSGGGKSSLLDELARRGYAVVEEPGRRIVREEQAKGGTALPWADATAFVRRAITMSLADLQAAPTDKEWVFFDRGLVDAAAALQHLTAAPAVMALGRAHRYHHTVFLAPPWPEIFANDPERQLDFESARAEYERLADAYRALGYGTIILPRTGVSERADFVLARLAD